MMAHVEICAVGAQGIRGPPLKEARTVWGCVKVCVQGQVFRVHPDVYASPIAPQRSLERMQTDCCTCALLPGWR